MKKNPIKKSSNAKRYQTTGNSSSPKKPIDNAWKQKLDQYGYISLVKEEPVFYPQDLINPAYVWCFCDTMFLAARFTECPVCKTKTANVQTNG